MDSNHFKTNEADGSSGKPSNFRIQLIYIRAGDGHLTTAEALYSALTSALPDVTVQKVDLQSQQLLGSLDFLSKVSRLSSVDLYNLMLKLNLTYLDPLYLLLSRLAISSLYNLGAEVLSHHWQRTAPSMVISVVPLFNGLIAESLKATHPSVPFLTIMTDLCDVPPDYWFDENTQFCLVPTARAQKQAEQSRIPPYHLRQSSGLILREQFYSLKPIDQESERQAIGLNPTTPTLLLMFGGNGSTAMKLILRQLRCLPEPIQAICICGRNQELMMQIQGLDLDYPVSVVGYTDRIPYYMALADIFLGKPGNISVSEAVHMGLPVITVENQSTLVQERYTGTWLRENGYGETIPSWRLVRRLVQHFLSPHQTMLHRAALSQHANRGLQEAVDWIKDIKMQTHNT